jgi:hypothetical protein
VWGVAADSCGGCGRARSWLGSVLLSHGAYLHSADDHLRAVQAAAGAVLYGVRSSSELPCRRVAWFSAARALVKIGLVTE